MLLWLLLVLVTGGVLTENPPSSQRLVGTAVPAIFCLALGVQGFVRAAGRIWGGVLTARALNLAAICALLAVLGLRYYFGPYQDSWRYGTFNGEVATRAGYYLRDLPGDRGWVEYWFGAPRMWADFGSIPFLAPGVWLYEVDRLSGPVDFVDRSRNAVFLFLPERIGDLRAVQAVYPRGPARGCIPQRRPAGAAALHRLSCRVPRSVERHPAHGSPQTFICGGSTAGTVQPPGYVYKKGPGFTRNPGPLEAKPMGRC